MFLFSIRRRHTRSKRDWSSDVFSSDLAGSHAEINTVTILVSALTVLIFAWLPALELSRLTPLEAIKNTGELQLKREKRSPILARSEERRVGKECNCL